MKKIASLPWIRKVCNRCGRFFLIHENIVWTGNKTCHYECWTQEKRENVMNQYKKPGIAGRLRSITCSAGSTQHRGFFLALVWIFSWNLKKLKNKVLRQIESRRDGFEKPWDFGRCSRRQGYWGNTGEVRILG
jgi:hypothetical protein